MVPRYVSNVAIAAARVPKALLGLYWFNPADGYVKNVFSVIDCLVNAVCLGDPDETISSRSGKARDYEQSHARYGWGCRMCAFLNIFQKDHCDRAIEHNKGGRAVNSDAGTQRVRE